MPNTVTKTLTLILCLILAAGCATFPAAGEIARANNFEKQYIKTDIFTLTSYHRFTGPDKPLHIYIEGDGRAWQSRTRLSNDPTPHEALVLELASLDPAENVAYIARPGQYTAAGADQCDSAYWSDKRFSEEVIRSMDQAVDEISAKAGTKNICLIGYSGGGAVAVLIAARRSDVKGLMTIAGNLDPDAVNRYHCVSPLKGPLNPMDVADKIKDIPQVHFIGSEDTIVPASIARSFVMKMGDKDYHRIIVVDGATHTEGWQKRWKELMR